MGRPPRGPVSREVQVSKKLSWLLRHHVKDEGLDMDEAGYVNLQDVLNNRNIKSLKVTFDEVRSIVSSNDKQRFSLIPAKGTDGSRTSDEEQPLQVESTHPSDYLIRANQGHSVAIESDKLLTPIDGSCIPNTCVHGTTRQAWILIAKSGGLKRMNRQHIHFAPGLPEGFQPMIQDGDEQEASQDRSTAAPVISGMRNTSSVLVYVDVERAIGQGIKFWRSENGVILSEGDASGSIPIELFQRVEDRTGKVGILVQDGKTIKEAPEDWATKRPTRQDQKPTVAS